MPSHAVLLIVVTAVSVVAALYLKNSSPVTAAVAAVVAEVGWIAYSLWEEGLRPMSIAGWLFVLPLYGALAILIVYLTRWLARKDADRPGDIG